MATMAMATVKNSLLKTAIFLPFIFISSGVTGEWDFTPHITLDETYTDNVELSLFNSVSSYVTQTIVGLNTEYTSRIANLTLNGTKSYAMYSHNSELNDDFNTLNVSGSFSLWADGLTLVSNASIANISRNSATNSLADLVSGDTIESKNNSTGIQYSINNSNYSLNTSFMYSTIKTEDNIGESDGFTAQLNSASGNNARSVFWKINSNYSKKEQFFSGTTRDGEQYSIDATLGMITSFNLNPFVRFYDEDIKGSIANQNQNITSSIGPGIRWRSSSHFIIDLSYNFVKDDTVSDDYIAATIDWQPSARTSLVAGYNQRFFGESYNLDFKHKTKRLTNSVSYNESLQAFDRNSFQRNDLGAFWCPIENFTGETSQCSPQDEPPVDIESYQLLGFSELELITNTEFLLYKRFAWSSKLQLSRTSFAINVSAYRREGLESNVIDDNLDTSLVIERKVSAKSTFSLSGNFRYSIFDKENPEGSRQEDYYRTISASYKRKLASSLSSNFSIQHVNRSSTVERYSYEELRAIINITKEF